ncbi:IclR family transcriptional regulator [Pseudonocardia sp. C8]|uniref:IclR family transcriptional regulator n=1 Tax=Pseudonocardia sp. C8 TaxID=2762759 RepID=UPI001642BD83|nr:IclR family transcriptional regulator [Pseudonocardia sp. C8]MBC3191942.1 IclR family transcriptional regulator [Pseudonocardia sp. C8]
MSGSPAGPPAPQYPIESVDRTLQVLTQLADRRELKLSEVRAHLGVGQSTAHRLMAMLVYRGFAVQDPDTRAYRPGPALFGIAAAAADSFDVARAVRPVLERLAEETGETVHLGVLSGTAVRYLDVVESPAALRVTGRVGRLTPAHATSLGKAMLATYDDDRVRELYAGRELRAQTPATIVDLDRLLAELGRTRARGWARNRGEMEPGVCSVGVGTEVAALGLRCGLSVATPAVRSTPAVERAHAGLLGAAVARLSGILA